MVGENVGRRRRRGAGRRGAVREAGLRRAAAPVQHRHDVRQAAAFPARPWRSARASAGSGTSPTRRRSWPRRSAASNILESGNANWSQLDDPGLNEQMRRAALVTDRAERAQAWADIDARITRLAPAIPWIWLKQANIRSANVVGDDRRGHRALVAGAHAPQVTRSDRGAARAAIEHELAQLVGRHALRRRRRRACQARSPSAARAGATNRATSRSRIAASSSAAGTVGIACAEADERRRALRFAGVGGDAREAGGGLVPEPVDAFTPEDLDLLAEEPLGDVHALQEQRGEAGVAERERERDRLAGSSAARSPVLGRVGRGRRSRRRRAPARPVAAVSSTMPRRWPQRRSSGIASSANARRARGSPARSSPAA